MPRYRIIFTETREYTKIIQADNQDKAEQLASEKVDEETLDHYDGWSYNVTDEVTVVTPWLDKDGQHT